MVARKQRDRGGAPEQDTPSKGMPPVTHFFQTGPFLPAHLRMNVSVIQSIDDRGAPDHLQT